MPKFNKEIDELETRFEKWMYVIKNLGRLDNLPDKLRETVFEKMFAAAEVAQLTQEEYMGYIKNVLDDWTTYSVLETAKKKARAKGLAEGRAEGEAKTLEQVVLQAHRSGFSMEQIQSLTHLTEAQIVEILNKVEESK